MVKNNLDGQFNELKRELMEYGPNSDISLLDKAWEFTKIAHAGQKRFSGDPYVTHELETAKILAAWKLDLTSIIAGLLHDTVDEGAAKLTDIKGEFGEDVAHLVDGVTRVSYLKLRGSQEEQFVENLRKMFLAMAKDLRVVLVKLADRLHNMQTLSFVPEEKQKRIARETLEIFAPLAERLGMGGVKTQLDDLSFPYVYPEEYEKVKKLSQAHYKEAEKHIQVMRKSLLKILAKENVKPTIQARKKHLYSLWKKLQCAEVSWDFDKVLDIVAMRIIVNTIPECYAALGIVYRQYTPVPHLGVSDFIAQPKPNGYQSIHTKVFGPKGRIVEVQIRTQAMHEEAEFGIAAHWAYSDTKAKDVKSEILEQRGGVIEKKLSWVKELAEWQKEIKDSKEFLEAVKFDALKERIFIFSPKGDVFDLPLGATPIDFAYAVHTDLPRYVKSAKANGKMVPLNYKLKSGEVVEIEKTKLPKDPSSGWSEFVATTTARREIGKYLRKSEEKS